MLQRVCQNTADKQVVTMTTPDSCPEKLKKRDPVYYMREHVKELPAAEKKVVAKRNSGSFTNVREEPD